MDTAISKLDTDSVKSFISENKVLIAAIGGITLGLTVASLLGNEKARQTLRTLGSTVAGASGKLVSSLGDYKQLLAPLFSKTDVQGV
jgi:hypothetical protein